MEEYPLPKFHFEVKWFGIRASFSEVSGLDVETEVLEYREGTNKQFNNIKIPAKQKYSNVTLKRGYFKNDPAFYLWWNTFKLGNILREPVLIFLLNEEHFPVVVWALENAWPIKVQSTDLKSAGNEVAIETLELTHEGLTII